MTINVGLAAKTWPVFFCFDAVQKRFRLAHATFKCEFVGPIDQVMARKNWLKRNKSQPERVCNYRSGLRRQRTGLEEGRDSVHKKLKMLNLRKTHSSYSYVLYVHKYVYTPHGFSLRQSNYAGCAAGCWSFRELQAKVFHVPPHLHMDRRRQEDRPSKKWSSVVKIISLQSVLRLFFCRIST